jgi:hypothetical protein
MRHDDLMQIASVSVPTDLSSLAKNYSLRVCAAVILLFAVASVFSAYRKDITQGFDEVAHTSYVAYLQSRHTASAYLEDMRMLNPSTFRFTGAANYLNHPSPYYAALAAVGPGIERNPGSLFVHRLINVGLATLGVAFLLAIGMAARLPRNELYAYVVPLACIPVLAQLAGSVNNDNLAFVGGALAMFAIYNLLASGRSAWLLAALAGVVVASWAKLTGLMLVGGFVTAAVGYLMLRRRLSFVWAAPVIGTLVVASIPYILFMMQYDSPTPNTPAQIALLVDGAKVAGWDHNARLSLPAYVMTFIFSFVVEWMPSLTSRSAVKTALAVIPASALLCALVGTALAGYRVVRRTETVFDVVVLAGMAALAVTFVAHIGFSYQRHLATGWMMDAYPRYYLPLIAVVPLACLGLLSSVRPQLRTGLLVMFVSGPIIFSMFSAVVG